MHVSEHQRLHTLARLHRVQTAFHDLEGVYREARPEALLRVLRVLGAPVDGLNDVADAIRARRLQLHGELAPPAAAVWDGWRRPIKLRVPARDADAPVEAVLRLEGGEERRLGGAVDQTPVLVCHTVEGAESVVRSLPLPADLPWGYHRLQTRVGSRSADTLLISAPTAFYHPESDAHARNWGVFMPLYAIAGERGFGAGDFSHAVDMIRWMNSLGGKVLATLPVHAEFLDHPLEYSPYSPASRLFWNEFHVDPTRVPEWPDYTEAHAVLDGEGMQRALSEQRQGDMIDYKKQMTLRRRVLEKMAEAFFAEPRASHADFMRFLERHPEADDYARYRAAVEQAGGAWMTWDEPRRSGTLTPGDYNEAAKNYHLYVQWLAARQIEDLAGEASTHGPGLYLDMPLGVNTDSYDVWRRRELFALGMAGGAPPDAFFSAGQDWGFPPMHPDAMRREGYDYLRKSLRLIMHHAGILRIDHVMGLHRLYWIPEGCGAGEGMYVHYPADELYAVYALESHRHQTVVIGEDLGTVPAYVRESMNRHRLSRMYVMQFGISTDERDPIAPVEPGMVASINTHDTPTFAAFWKGLDIEDRVDLGLLDEEGRRAAHEERAYQRRALTLYLRNQGLLGGDEEAIPDIVWACLRWLGRSPAETVLVNLEDLWAEERPQNVPGTWRERPNWLRKTAHTLESFTHMPRCTQPLKELDSIRRDTKDSG